MVNQVYTNTILKKKKEDLQSIELVGGRQGKMATSTE